MATAKVFRPERNWRGENVGGDGYLGEVAGVIVGGPSVQPLAKFPGTVDTSGMLGIPYAQTSGISVRQHDRLLIGSTQYAITSDPQWTDENTLTGTPPTHYWVEYRSTS
ncbi:hypothetical protein [Mycobacterium sp. SMC-4]|uniref:hypothetical protein n=1 Tax=Mycobacterium sp. SMC-4 TaxID=2857059 RepID=UPI003D01EBCD